MHPSKYDLNRQTERVFILQKVIRVECSDRELLQAKKFRIVQRTEQRVAGLVSQEIILQPGAVAIVAVVDPEHLCLIKNRRMAVEETLVELPAGTLDVGEEPHLAAVRVLREETGFAANEMIPLGECFMSPGILQEKMFFFVARGLTLGEPALEDDEQIENQIVTREEAIAMVIDGRICDAKTMVGLLLFDRLKVY